MKSGRGPSPRRRRGRPPEIGRAAASRVVKARVTASQYRALVAWYKSEGIEDVSAALRRLIELHT